MLKYPLWKYLIIIFAVIIGFLYTLPNFYGDVPAVQISSGTAGIAINPETLSSIETSCDPGKMY